MGFWVVMTRSVCPCLYQSSEALWIDSAVVPSKGDAGEYSVSVFKNHIRHMGHSNFIHKSDQERALKSLMAAGLAGLRDTVTAIPESSPGGAKGTKGSMEMG